MGDIRTVQDLVSVLRHLLDANRYVTVCAYVAGAAWAAPKVLDGFQEFLGVSHDNYAAAWPTSVLIDKFERPDIALVLNGAGHADMNDEAVSALIDALESFGEVVDNDMVLGFKQRYETGSASQG